MVAYNRHTSSPGTGVFSLLVSSAALVKFIGMFDLMLPVSALENKLVGVSQVSNVVVSSTSYKGIPPAITKSSLTMITATGKIKLMLDKLLYGEDVQPVLEFFCHLLRASSVRVCTSKGRQTQQKCCITSGKIDVG
jgi:hypothetical protein